MGDSYWRGRARPIIAKVIAEHAGRPQPEVRRALREAYPFGPRQHHPYKIWCDEVKRQLGLKPPLGSPRKVQAANPNQRELFDGR